MSKMNGLTFENVFKITSFGLWISGSHPALPRGWLFRFLSTISTCSFCFVILFNSIISYRIPRGDYDNVVRESIMAIVAFTLICKCIIIVRNRAIMLNVIRYIDGNLKSENFSAAERKIISKYMNRGVFVSKLWSFISFLSGSSFIMKGFLSTIYYFCKGEDKYVHIFEVLYPSFIENRKDKLLGYTILSFISIVFDVYAVSEYSGFDPLLCIFLLHFCGQLEVLSKRMRNILNTTQNSEQILSKMKEINKELQIIYKLVEDVQNTFLALFEFTMKTTTILVPCIVFQITQALRRDVLKVEFLALLWVIVLQFLTPCLFSDLVLEKSEYMRQAIYCCGWETHPNPKIRKIVIFMLTRTSKPVVLHTIFYPLTLETFAEMGRQAYAIYSIMSAVWT